MRRKGCGVGVVEVVLGDDWAATAHPCVERRCADLHDPAQETEMAAIDRHLDTRDAGKPVELGLIKHPKTDIREPRASRATQPPV